MQKLSRLSFFYKRFKVVNVCSPPLELRLNFCAWWGDAFLHSAPRATGYHERVKEKRGRGRERREGEGCAPKQMNTERKTLHTIQPLGWMLQFF